MDTPGKTAVSSSGGRMAMVPSQPTGSCASGPPPKTPNIGLEEELKTPKQENHLLPDTPTTPSKAPNEPRATAQDKKDQEDTSLAQETRVSDSEDDEEGKGEGESLSSSVSTIDLRLGYPTAAFETDVARIPEDAVLVRLEGIWRHGHHIDARFWMQAEVPIGNILAFLQKELGLNLSLQIDGTEIDPGRTLLSLRAHQELKVQVVHLLKRAISPGAGPAIFPSKIFGVALYFDFGGTPPDVQGVIVPCGATFKMIWEREFCDYRINPRLLLDGERLSLSSTVGVTDLTEGVIIQVAAEQVGGAPPPNQAYIEDEPAEEDDSPNTFEPHSRPVFFIPDHEYAEETSPSSTVPAHRRTGSGDSTTGHVYSNRPVPTFPNELMFFGDRPEDFFSEFEHRCKIFRIPKTEWFANLRSRLCKDRPHDIRTFAENLPEWEKKDYDGVKEELINNFSDGNEDKFVVADLTGFVKQKREIRNTAELNKYIVSFKTISNFLLKHELVTDTFCRNEFLRGLPKGTREKLERMDLEPRTRLQPTFKQVEADVRETFKPTAFYARYNQLADQEKDREDHPEHLRRPDLVPGTKSPQKEKQDEKVGKLAELMSTLTLNINRMCEHGNSGRTTGSFPAQRSNQTAQPGPGGPHGPVPTTVYQGDPTRRATASAGPPTGPTFTSRGCFYCKEVGHGMRACPIKQRHLDDGIISQAQDGKTIVCADGNHLPWTPGQMHLIAQQRYEAWRDKTKEAASSLTHRFEYGADDDDDREFMPFDCDSCDSMILTSNLQHYQCANAGILDEFDFDTNAAEKHPLGEGASPDPPAKRTRKATQQQAHAKNTPAPAPVVAMEEDDGNELTEEEEETTKNLRSKRPPPQNWNLSPVQEHFSAQKTVERILEQNVPVPLKDALGMNPDLRKTFMSHLRSRRVARIGPQVHFSGNATLGGETTTEPFYTHSLPIIDVSSPHLPGRTLKALVDTGSEIDMISPEIVRAARVPVRKDGKHRVVGINNQPERLGGLVEGFQLTVGAISASLHVWLRECLGYDVLIGMPGIRQWGMTIRMKGDQGHIEVVGTDGVRVKIQALRVQDPRNRQYLPPNLGRVRVTPVPDSEDSSSD